MAFNFNWSPLIADTSKAREMLTAALNKSQKPPIIVDDIIVTELNLGSVPPELEILEIGDLAEDRFRGIFKMSYAGDAYFALKTRVQANPLHTYLSTKPSFASPQPLAASSGLTIPLQITLSDIRLSGFVILVFSRQKGITLVFRNDPLESLKVSSTFDTIPFVRDYLQKEIEGQLRELFMEDLPAIIHRLSLKLLHEDAVDIDEGLGEEEHHDETEIPVNPFGSPSHMAHGDVVHAVTDLDLTQMSPLDPLSETGTKFSHKNLLRLAALTDSHRTLSLFTPSIHDSVYRAWAFAAERGEIPSTAPSGLNLASLPRHNSRGSNYSSSAHSVSEHPGSTSPSVPSSAGFSSMTGLSGSKSRHGGRRGKRHVVNLRKQKEPQVKEEETGSGSRPTTPTSATYSSSQGHTGSEEREGELITPPVSPESRIKHRRANDSIDSQLTYSLHSSPSQGFSITQPREDTEATPRANPPAPRATPAPTAGAEDSTRYLQEIHSNTSTRPRDPGPISAYPFPSGEKSAAPLYTYPSTAGYYGGNGGILEQAWMMKMANEIARKVASEKAAAEAAAASGSAQAPGEKRRLMGAGFWDEEAQHEGDETPPPAYAA